MLAAVQVQAQVQVQARVVVELAEMILAQVEGFQEEGDYLEVVALLVQLLPFLMGEAVLLLELLQVS